MNLLEIFEHQDIILTISFSILVIMSVISWSIIIIRLLKIVNVKHRNLATLNAFWSSKNISDAESYIKNDKSVIAEILRNVLPTYNRYYDKQEKLSGLTAQLSLKDYLTLNIRNAISLSLRKFDTGLVALASIGAVAPFIGLFGTVWGIFNALMDISQQGQVSIATVSAPIGEALVATAMGLFVAIPAVLAYNAISRLNRNLSQDLDAFAHDLYVYLLNREGE
ncbi:MotA/TolQ/ExbB proton channel family protein [Otariodibacter oris]|uniref:Biopolymer transport protein ExbB n=1 Tax=Otariodibacter oris TaxID=1032623 RepID=A0A420XHK1_9PAST|nr:MotA/TolQ/ExbB proton channel family protein [Otariodibacter oris]QGM80993.1 biopolymer transporter ExbB [Otariodibacter oris]RKR76827.1 outer membrane transport energization protein ExbB [Otariodibacter oris]